MVALEEVQGSNDKISTSLPLLVAVFVGATSGIGETSLREFARHAGACHVYFVGRSQEAGDRITAECKALNPQAEIIFLQADVSLLKNVDELCLNIKGKEKHINILFLSQGTLKFRTKTPEGLHYAMAVSYYSRTRFALNLLPLLRTAPGLRRVVSVLAGGKEGEVIIDDWEGWRLPFSKARGHLSSMLTMSLQCLAQEAPDVSFVHDFPGWVDTNLIRSGDGAVMQVLKYVSKLIPPTLRNVRKVPLRECGERHLFLCTSARYPAGKEGEMAQGVPLDGKNTLADGVNGKIGSGVYSVDWDGESANVADLLARYEAEGVRKMLWEHTQGQFVATTGKPFV